MCIHTAVNGISLPRLPRQRALLLGQPQSIDRRTAEHVYRPRAGSPRVHVAEPYRVVDGQLEPLLKAQQRR